MSIMEGLEIGGKAKKVGGAKKAPRAKKTSTASKPRSKKKQDSGKSNIPAVKTATGSGGGGKKPPKASTSTSGSKDIVPSSGKSIRPAPTRQGRTEKFMGNAQRVGSEALPAPARKATAPKSNKLKYAVAGGAAVLAASLYGGGKKKQAVQATVAPRNQGGDGLSPVSGPTAQKKAMPAAPRSAPAKSSNSGTKSGTQTKRSSSGGQKAGKNQSMADFLGLSKDSAVRTYMETGKHKYTPRYPKK